MRVHAPRSVRPVLVLLSALTLALMAIASAGGVLAQSNGASLNIHKKDETGARLAGAVFAVEGMSGTFTTDAQGEACITGLARDTEWVVTEIQAPPGYQIASPATRTVRVDNDGDCNSPDVTFVNTKAPVQQATPTPTPVVTQATPTPTPAAAAQAATPTPRESALAGAGGPRGGGQVPNTATQQPMTLPVWAFAVLLLASLGSLLWLRLAWQPHRTD